MRKHTTLDLDQELIRDAAAALGTTRTTETVHAALADVVARRRRAMLARLDLPDLTPEAVAAMRAPRHAETTPDEPAPPAPRHAETESDGRALRPAETPPDEPAARGARAR